MGIVNDRRSQETQRQRRAARDAEMIVAAIADLLGVHPERLEKCRATILRDVEHAKWRIRTRGKGEQPGIIKRDIGPIRAAAAKLQQLTKRPTLATTDDSDRPRLVGHTLFADFLDCRVGYRTDRNFEALQACLNAVIETCDRLKQEIVVPKGKKPHEYARYEARALAENLVVSFAGFSAAYFKHRGKAQPRDGAEWLKLESEVKSQVALLVYELVTGRRDVVISESAAELKPSTIRTRRRVGA